MDQRPISAVGNRRPVSEYAKMAASMGSNPRYKVTGRDSEGMKADAQCNNIYLLN